MTEADANSESYFGSIVLEPASTKAPDTPAKDATTYEPEIMDDASTDHALRRRVEDLSAQITFLDSENIRYRESLEAERVRHAKELLDLTHQTDRRVDDAERSERRRADEVHDSYRSLLAERQIELEQAISDLNAQHARELHAERERHKDILADLRHRSDTALANVSDQVTEELTDAHRVEIEVLTTELNQLSEAVDRLQRINTDYERQLAETSAAAQRHATQASDAARRITLLEEQNRAQLSDLEAQVASAEARVSAERRRAAATVAEVLEHSASIASEADVVRSEAAQHKARADSLAASVRKQARFEYDVLAEESDERAYRASVREAELEDVIAKLQAQLARYQSDA